MKGTQFPIEAFLEALVIRLFIRSHLFIRFSLIVLIFF